jgi:hypothetical protein
VTLDREDIEAIATRVAALLEARALGSPQEPSGLVDAAVVARELGVERDWVYSHAKELGAIRLGGPHGRLRFDLNKVLEGDDSTASGRRASPVRRRAPRRLKPNSAPRLKVKSHKKQRRASGSAPAQRLSDNTGR